MSDNTPCPKCKQEIPSDAPECPYCGVIPTKYRTNGDPPVRVQPPSSPAPASQSQPPAAASSAETGLYEPDASPAIAVGHGTGSTAAVPGAPSFGNPQGPVTDVMIEHLSKTGPWVTLMAALFFLSAVLIALSAVFGMGGASAAGISPLFIFVPYAVLGVLYLVLSLQLFNFGQSARRVGMGGGIESIEEALGYQWKFWRLLGIIALVSIGLLILIFVLAFFAGFALSGAAGR